MAKKLEWRKVEYEVSPGDGGNLGWEILTTNTDLLPVTSNWFATEELAKEWCDRNDEKAMVLAVEIATSAEGSGKYRGKLVKTVTITFTLAEAEALHLAADNTMGDDQDIEAALGGDGKSAVGKAAYRAIDKLNRAIQGAK